MSDLKDLRDGAVERRAEELNKSREAERKSEEKQHNVK